ncbi:MAG: hypothetical protein ABW007_05565 [Chitinophagaceae bacterium]
MAGKKVLEKRMRMVLDFEVVVEELTEEALHTYYRRSRNYKELVDDPEGWENLRRQMRLQRALLEDETALPRFLTLVVVDEVDSQLDSRLGEVFGVGGMWGEEEILEPIFSELEEEDERYFREVSAATALFDSIEVLSRSFSVRWVDATLEETKRVAEGSFDDLSV